jgi:hypothetical protein
MLIANTRRKRCAQVMADRVCDLVVSASSCAGSPAGGATRCKRGRSPSKVYTPSSARIWIWTLSEGGAVPLDKGHEVRLGIARAKASALRRLEEVFARRGIVAAKALEFATLEAILACVAAAGGISLMPHRLADTLGPVRGAFPSPAKA